MGAKLEADGVIIITLQDRGRRQRLVDPLFTGLTIVENFWTLRARLVGSMPEEILWTQVMNFKIEFRLTVLSVFSPPLPPTTAESGLAVARRMIDRLVADVWAVSYTHLTLPTTPYV